MIVDKTNNSKQRAGAFSNLLDEYRYQRPQRGEIVEGEILHIQHDAVYVDVGAKRDAIVPHSELDTLADTVLEEISEGDHVPVYVLNAPAGDDELFVSLEKGLQKHDWDRAQRMLESEEISELEVVGYNKGGLLVQFHRLQGFVPNSHMPGMRRGWPQAEQQRFKAQQVGIKRKWQIIEVDHQRQRLVLSGTAVEQAQRKERLEALKVGQLITGRVTSLVKFGAFVDIGGLDGLIHISKLAHHHVKHPSEVLGVGEEVNVVVDKVDVERERISLNRKALLPSAWDTLLDDYGPGDLIEGVVTNVVDFGAFVSVEVGIVGLIHKSELDLGANARPDDRLQTGDMVLARILEIDPQNERLGLSLRKVSMAEEIEWMSRAKTEAPVTDAEETSATDAEEASVTDSESDATELE